jgi:DNA polymerase lambda
MSAPSPSHSVSVKVLLESLQSLANSSTGFRKSAFLKAYASVKNVKNVKNITRDELAALPGVGKGVLERFDELVKTGALSELKGKEEEEKVVSLFEGIYGVGPILAKKWYDKGYKTLSDIPANVLTPSQSLGLKYYSDINSRIPRSEIDGISVALQNLVKVYNSKNNTQIRAKICGSYLRGRESSGDIDIIISDVKDSPFIEKFLEEGKDLFHHVLAQGISKVLTLGGIGTRERRIDLELVLNCNWAYALLYFTGSKDFNRHMRGVAKDKGYLLNHSGLFAYSMKIHLETEKDIFEFLEMEYLTPEERDAY